MQEAWRGLHCARASMSNFLPPPVTAPPCEAVQAGSIPEALVDVSVTRILQKKFELGLFENPFVDVEHVLEVYETPAQRQLARQIATSSIVLLKNEGGPPPPFQKGQHARGDRTNRRIRTQFICGLFASRAH